MNPDPIITHRTPRITTSRRRVPDIDRFTAFVHDTGELIKADGNGLSDGAMCEVIARINAGHIVIIGGSYDATREVAEGAMVTP